jgi:hypothetical protein
MVDWEYMKSKAIENLLKQEMTRKDFLKLAGTTLVGVVGISNVLKNLDKFSTPEKKTASKENKVTSGYGSSVYGR